MFLFLFSFFSFFFPISFFFFLSLFFFFPSLFSCCLKPDIHWINRPAIIDEKVRTDRVVEVQPVIHKEIEQPVVHHVEQHIVEPAAPNVGGVIRNTPIVEEHVKTKVIEGNFLCTVNCMICSLTRI